MSRRGFHVALLLIPLLVYWPTVFHDYGFRDDYAHLREAREIPEHLVRFTSSYGRPGYGALLVVSVGPLQGKVENLRWLRLGAVVLLACVAMVLMRLLQRAGWPRVESAAIGAAIVLLPAAQVTAGWAIAWPIALALLLSLSGFGATDLALARKGARRAVMWAAGFAAYLAAGLIYQPSALFFVVPLAGALLIADSDARTRLEWTAAHLATALGGIAVGFAAMRIAFAAGWLKQAGVFGIESDPLAKLEWFLSMPVANSLALFVLRDLFDTPLAFWLAAALVVVVIAAGLVARGKSQPVDRWTLAFCLLVLPFVALAINLAAALRVPSYRTTYGLAGLVLVLLVYALRNLAVRGWIGRRAHHAALGVIILGAAVAANRHAYTLIAQPQGWEWQIVREAAYALPLRPDTTVYAIRSTLLHDRATRRAFADEFGTLSSDTEWAVSEMLKCALRRRFPSGPPAGFGYKLTTGLEAPAPGAFDLVIDMRKLRQYRER